MLTGLTASFPELVTTVPAVRASAHVLAVGGNAFDVLFLGLADIPTDGMAGKMLEEAGYTERMPVRG